MSENKPKSVLDDLYSDSGAFDKEATVKVLKNFVVIQRNTNKIFIKDQNLTNEEKILAYALAKLLQIEEGLITADQDGVSALEVKENLGINANTVDVTFMNLKNQRLIIPTGKKVGKQVKYSIPTFNVKQVVSRLEGKVYPNDK